MLGVDADLRQHVLIVALPSRRVKAPKPAGLPAFAQLYEHSADSVLILAEDGRRILDANPRAAKMMGLTRSELIGKDMADYLSQGLKELPAFAKAIQIHGVAWTDTFALPSNKNGPKPVDVSASGFELPHGKFTILVIHEALAPTDEKDRAAKTAADTADYYNERMARFEQDVLNRTAHDIRTPITPILIRLALLERSLGPLLNDADKESIQTIRRNVERLESHVKDVILAATQDE